MTDIDLDAPVTRGELQALVGVYNDNFANLTEVINDTHASLLDLGEVVNDNATALDQTNAAVGLVADDTVAVFSLLDRALLAVQALAEVVQEIARKQDVPVTLATIRSDAPE